MTTAREVILDSLEKIGVYSPGESVQDADVNRALVVLNDMLSGWSEEYLTVYVLSQVLIPTVANQIAYTIGVGAGAGISLPRPTRIAGGPGAAIASPTIVALGTTAAALANFPILEFGAVGGVAVGQSVIDVTNPNALPMGVTVQGISGNSVTLSTGAVAPGVQVGDVIAFGSAPQQVNVVSPVEWANITSVNLSSGVPDTLFYDPQYPLGVLNLSPIPNASGYVMFSAWEPLLAFANLSLPDVNFAAGGETALKNNLAVRLKNYFNDAVVPVTVLAEAALTKSTLQYTNITSRAMLRRGVQRPQPGA